MDSIKNLEWRYAVKKFDSEKILPQEKIERLKQAFNLTATSYGLQPITLVVIRNKELQKELVEHSFGQQQVVQASHVLVICIQSDIDEAYISRYFEQIKKIRGTSPDILDPFKKALVADFSKKEVHEIEQWSKNQAYLALGNLLTICAMEKIDSCPMEGFLPSVYDTVLNLKEKGLTSVLVLPVGYRADDDMFSEFKKVRKNIEESIIEIN
ncbi:nitroreductase family protein [Zobellia galactanivorans]|uniref:nitroreductase family protein n=1 Tax=Zobellia galactanivorans (strain DSM 12802 / CCUG 47099 / CIP 106680 / NCIMB 13871 / Dsij) TaxID=63186 RepID=UPI001C079DDE|nr:nitroreductase family protein [Zobellia galactanivorans]MBU3025686.1 nitroreductase family protein [Zobellia galactanivorans]